MLLLLLDDCTKIDLTVFYDIRIPPPSSDSLSGDDELESSSFAAAKKMQGRRQGSNRDEANISNNQGSSGRSHWWSGKKIGLAGVE